MNKITYQPSPYVNLIIGKNGVGKTTLLEAMSFLTLGRSFRTNHLKEVVQKGQSGFAVEGLLELQGMNYEFGVTFFDNQKKLYLNRNLSSADAFLFGKCKAVALTPDIQTLVRNAPALRRRYLDDMLSEIDSLYVHYLARYQKGMRIRNALLKKRDYRAAASFETLMASSGAYITDRRKKALELLEPIVRGFFEQCTKGSKKSVNLSYESKSGGERSGRELMEFLQEEYSRKREKEAILGLTLTGPHRDDISIKLNGMCTKEEVSEGEARLLAIALKLAEWQKLYSETGVKPLLFIDDCVAFLDQEKVSNLGEIVKGFGQVFVTAHSPLKGFEGEVFTLY